MPAGTSAHAEAFINAFSLEVSAKAMPALRAEADRIPRGTVICIPWLASEDDDARLAAVRTVRALGFEPMPHLSARRIGSRTALERFLERATSEAGVERCLLIAGDLATPAGPFADSASIIETGRLERFGIKFVGIGGHPEGHPAMSGDAAPGGDDRPVQRSGEVEHGLLGCPVGRFDEGQRTARSPGGGHARGLGFRYPELIPSSLQIGRAFVV